MKSIDSLVVRKRDIIHASFSCALLLTVAFTWSPSFAPTRHLTFEERVDAQKKIEEVYWRHRAWPTENPTPKPPRSSVMTDEAIRLKVEDSLKKSEALETYWRRPVTAAQLQAELNRMASRSRNPEMLRELFAALDDDPVVVAECLAKPVLVDRLIHNWYAYDPRFHNHLRAKAASELGRRASVADMKAASGAYQETTWIRGDDRGETGGERAESAITLPSRDFDEWMTTLRRRFSSEETDPPLRVASPLHESSDSFFVVAVLDRKADRVLVATTSWAKQPFDEWWAEIRASIQPRLDRTSTSPDVGFEAESALPAIAGSGCTDDDTWASIAPAVPDPRRFHTAVWTGSEMIVWGGLVGSVALNTGGRYDPATDVWTPTSTGAGVPASRRNHTAVWTGSEMIVWGGAVGSAALYTGGRYNPATDAWTPTSTGANLPPARHQHTAVWTGSEMIVWGGYYWDGSDHYLNSGGQYDPDGDTWTATGLGADVPAARSYHTAVWTGSEMIVWGGHGDAYFESGGRYTPSTGIWTATSTGTNVPAARRFHAAIWSGTEMIVWGGQQGATNLNTGGRYDPGTDQWASTSVGANVPSARAFHTAVWTGSEVIVWGGVAGSTYYNTGARYSPATDGWTAASQGAGVPTARSQHTAVWTDSEMIVWGGYDGANSLDTGGRYASQTDSWAPTFAGTNVPLARRHHTAIWTGSEMIVWGGLTYDGSDRYANTGGRYTLATDAWAPTSTGVNVPVARSHHTAVWTGSEMIVWGGFGGSYLNSGGRYNPATDAWTPSSTGANVPVPRQDHTAVWTGSEMVVWGGFRGSVLNTGGRYAPATDSWAATAAGPTARRDHSAVWTGSTMIVWGGFDGASGLNSGGRYDPSANTWAPTSTSTGVPAARRFHTAVWTDSEMIVWGGYGGGYLNSGGRYNPTSDVWTPTSIGTNVPTSRQDHTAVWAGFEMIIWGGTANGTDGLDTGGRYQPIADAWTPSSAGPGVPTARRYHSAVWTESEMIVWGGDAGAALNSGGRYCACQLDVWYRDQDGDLEGDPASPLWACERPSGYVATHWDCNDSNPHCGFDCTDMDGDGWCAEFDCEDSFATCTTSCIDADEDGYYACADDCSDLTAAVYPGAPQLCDRRNNDCTDPDWPDLPAIESDADGDGASFCEGDCNDVNPSIEQGAIETCDGRDNDCDDQLDEGCDRICDSPRQTGSEVLVTNFLGYSVGASLVWAGGEYGVSWERAGDGIYFARIDAEGNKIGPEVRVSNHSSSVNASLVWTGSEYGVSWQDHRDGNFEIYLARLDRGGTKIGSDVRVTNDASDSSSPSLVWTGSEYGVSWEDLRDGNLEIYFARLDRAGARIGFDVRVTNEPQDSRHPSLLWTGDDYGVSWADRRDGDLEIYFAKLDALGSKIGSDVRVTSELQDSQHPSLIWTGAGFGVAWEDNRDGNFEIYYAKLDGGGTKIGSDVRVTDGASISRYPSLVWTGNECGVSWHDGGTLRFKTLTAEGAELASGRSLGDASSLAPSSLVWTGSEYGVSWDHPLDSFENVYFTRVSCCDDADSDGYSECGADTNDRDSTIHPGAEEVCDGRDNDSDSQVDEGCDLSCDNPERAAVEARVTNDEASSMLPSLVWTGSGYGVSWHDDRLGQSAIYFARLDATGNKLSPDVQVNDHPAQHPSLAWTGSEYGVSWRERRNGSWDIYFARLDAEGNKLGSDLRLTTNDESTNAARPSLVWTGREYGVSWMNEFGSTGAIYFARLDAAGNQLGSKVLVADASVVLAAVSLVWTGGGYGVSWDDSRDGNSEIYFARLGETGVKIGSDVRVTSNPSWSVSPSLVWTGIEYGVSWGDDRDGGVEIYFARLDAYGNKIGSDVRVTSDGAVSDDSSLVWNGSEYGVSWNDNRDGTLNFEIYFARLDAAGNKVGAEVRVTNDSLDSSYPSLVRTGSGYGVSWNDARDGNMEIYFSLVTCCDDVDADGYNECHECNDGAPTVYPGAPQVCDGLNNDCSASGWPALAGTNEADDDGDSLTECSGDCSDADATAWSIPGEATVLSVASDRSTVSWTAPAAPGGSIVYYDTLRSTSASDFAGIGVCVETDGIDTRTIDAETPMAGARFFYLVRAGNSCAEGPLGTMSSGLERSGRVCP